MHWVPDLPTRLVTYRPRDPEHPKMVATLPEKDDLNPWPRFIEVSSGTAPSLLVTLVILDTRPVSDFGLSLIIRAGEGENVTNQSSNIICVP